MIKLPFFRKNGKPPGARRTVDLFAVGKGDPLFHEKFKGLRAMVEQKSDLHGLRLLGITSSIAAEGKTLSCAQLGKSLASTGRKSVLLVDVASSFAMVEGEFDVSREVSHTRIQKSGLVLVGHMHGLVPTRVQVLGETEMSFLEGLSALRADRGMTAILIAHARIERFENPETESYDRYVPRLHRLASQVLQEWCDEVMFATFKVYTKQTDEGFDRKRNQGIGTGERVLRTVERPSHLAKNRLGLPEEMPLDWNVYARLERLVRWRHSPAASEASRDVL